MAGSPKGPIRPCGYCVTLRRHDDTGTTRLQKLDRRKRTPAAEAKTAERKGGPHEGKIYYVILHYAILYDIISYTMIHNTIYNITLYYTIPVHTYSWGRNRGTFLVHGPLGPAPQRQKPVDVATELASKSP